MPITITVTVPETGQSVSWEAMDRKSAIAQGKIEASKGAKVKVERDGIVIWEK